MTTKKTARKNTNFRLEDNLILAPYIAQKLGLEKLSEIKQFKDVPEGFDTDGRSYMFYAIRNLSPPIPEDKLREYDDNIRGYVDRLSKNRGEPIRLKYFQYLAVLFTEIYLDKYFSNPVHLVNELTKYSQPRFFDVIYSRNDLRKIAFWMATGSGKTLLMHINLWQYLAYQERQRRNEFENIILITSNEGMSRQHFEELRKSGIASRIFKAEGDGYFIVDDRHVVKIIDIYKLKLPEDKKGEGVTVDVSEFGHKNLVFVDEGHKGQKSEDQKWKQIRERLGKSGFTFEYSATFGQALTSKKDDVTDVIEYSKAILFDYSYKYFHRDGYGKDFRVLNLEKDDDRYSRAIMVANAMSFYEQILVYQQLGDKTKPYNIEHPLWIFVGSRVNEKESDILDVLRFFCELFENKNGWVENGIKAILEGKSGIPDREGRDVFACRQPETVFPYLRNYGFSAADILNGIYEKVFLIPPGTGRKLHLVDIKGTEGELGLRGGSATPYFGVINIGNKSDFKKLAEGYPDIKSDTAVMTKSLFDTVDKTDSSINILIGAKKFIEGWNCWRVSNMGLMNVGRSEGAQIIQLFGRGVRLKGLGHCLKRSNHLDHIHPAYIEVLENLGVFGIRADYMTSFRSMIELEDLTTYSEFRLDVRKLDPFPENLVIPKLREGADFIKDRLFHLSEVDGIKAQVNDLVRASVVESLQSPSIISESNQSGIRFIGNEYLKLLDWDSICLDMMRYRAERGMFNLAFDVNSLKRILTDQKYSLQTAKHKVEPSSFESLLNLQDLVIRILKNYFDRSYSSKRNGWEKDNYDLVPFKEDYENIPEDYSIQIDTTKEIVLRKAKELKDTGKVYTAHSEEPLPNVYFNHHLYQPLLAMPTTGGVITSPIGLNVGEKKFVQDLVSFLSRSPSEWRANGEVYLLRNFTRGKGIGFFETHSFYPDFILWIRIDSKQYLVFIDPKGLMRTGSLDDPKLTLHEFLKNNLQPAIGNPNVFITSFIISVTPYSSTTEHFKNPESMEKYEQKRHLLFQETTEGATNQKYIDRLFDLTLGLC